MQGRNTPATYEMSPPLPDQQVNLEVDKARQGEHWRWLGIGLVLLAAALFDGWQRGVVWSQGYQIEDLQRERAAEDALGRRLRLEIDSLRSPAEIERLARTELHLVAPGPKDSIVIERVVAPQQPPSSVVAAR